MSSDHQYLPFSQRNGLVEVPPQLKLGEVSQELRRLLFYYVNLEIDRETGYSMDVYFYDSWERVSRDIHVVFLGRDISEYRHSVSSWRTLIEQAIKQFPYEKLFDFVEFLVRHRNCSSELKMDLGTAFLQSRAAYRIVDNQIVAIGNDEQAIAFENAISDAETVGAMSARAHLVSAGRELAQSNWAGCVRESIHAVEAMAVKFAPEKKTLGAALAVLERESSLHGGLKNAFNALYGWSSDEEGVRHALVFKEEANVDEADALFMLGACAAFVSFLIARSSGQ